MCITGLANILYYCDNNSSNDNDNNDNNKNKKSLQYQSQHDELNYS